MFLHVLRAFFFVVVFFTSFRAMAAAPLASTTAATMISTSSASLNGTGNPNAEQATGWFRISSTNPGTCDDTFGTRVPAASGTDLGAGGSSIAYSITATGLSSGVTYYFCAIVQNASGMAFGSILSFTVPGAPAVTTVGVMSVTSTGATLQGSANPNAATATGWFRYNTTDPGTCNDSFGTRAPTSGGTALGSGTSPVDYTRAITGLSPGTTYYYCAIANNSYGNSFGTVQSFTTLANAPTVTTNSATLITGSSAQLNGSANPGGDATTGWYRFSTTNPGTCNDSFGTRAPSSGGQLLGAGNTAIAYSVGITGLTSSTTYYFCAIAQNTVGTGFGAVLSFTTPSSPSVTTTAATAITNTSATLNGTGIPNGAATTGYFRYSLTNPGTCNDVFGSRAPTSGGTALGTGTSAIAFSQSVTGLSPGTTYYFCAIASNSEGLGFGTVLNFTTPNVPTATTSPATLITASSATLNGAGNPSLNTAYGYYRYSTTNPGTCNDSFGTRAPAAAASDTLLGAGGTDVTHSRGITGLTPSTTYYFCALTRNTYGTAVGAILSFTTLATTPTVTTNGVTMLTGTSALLNASANPGGDSTTGWFRIATASPGTCNDSFGTRVPAAGGSALGAGITSVAYSQTASGLTPNTTYYYCAIGQNSVGTAFGAVLSFLTPTVPIVTTNAASAITNTTATLNGIGTPNGSATTGYFRYSTTNPGTCDDAFGSRAPMSGGTALGSGYSGIAFNQALTGLSPFTTYYYCAIVTSAEGMAFGAITSFTTHDLPTATTNAATLITSTTVTLNGAGNPKLNAAFGYYRYATTNPGTCNDSFGTRAPPAAASDTSLGSGSTDITHSRGITGLIPGTTYYFCALTRNTYGTAFGAVLSFTTLANAPTVTTNSATMLLGTSAQLNGSANPGGAAATGWFRYATTSPGTCNDSFGTRAPAAAGTALGSGNSAVAFSQAITGLLPTTTYYYCAIAQNSVGTSFGAVVSFTTPSPPTVTTNAATAITNTQATLNGNGVPNGSASTGYFRYSSTDPGTCNDAFGSRAPTSGGTALGSGTSGVNFAQTITGLSPNTTYYYCAIASSAEGLGFGAVMSFTTHDLPTATTAAATLITATTATLNGSGDPNLNLAYGYYRYATTNPGTCNDVFGTRAPATSASDTSLGSGTVDVAHSRGITGLTPGTTYYFCAISRNTYGNGYGAVLSFTTLAALPVVTTNSATLLTGTTAQLNGSANPGGAATTGWFRYATTSPGTCNDSFGTRAPAAGGSALGSGNSAIAFSQAISGLTPNTTYYYCAIGQNSVGTAFGAVLSFLTPMAPTVVTNAASAITNTAATLNGSGTPNGSATTGYFRYSSTNPGMCDDSFGSRAPAAGGTALGSGYSGIAFSQSLTGLSPFTTYYYCAIVTSAEGMAFGAIMSFTTHDIPTATSNAATLITATTATLNGLGNPKLNAAFGYYRYATTNPGTCNDSFGTRAPAAAASDTSLGSGSTDVAHSRGITGLVPGTTYYYCALTRNTYGTGFGAVLSFTTLANAPTVTTNAATLLTGMSAQLNGSANPGGAATTGWFRYSTTSPGTCNDSFGTRAPAAGGSALGSGNSAVAFSQSATGLTPATTYYYCAIAQNSVGIAFGAVVSFVTPTGPTVITNAATAITNTQATLNGSGDPNGAATTGYFRYSLTDPGACDDSFGSRAPAAGGSALGTGTSNVNFSQTITSLSPGTTYYYCAIASSVEGIAFGAILSFTTPTLPTVTTSAATVVTATTATINGSADPNLDTAYGYFRYATTNPGSCNDSFGTRIPTLSTSDTLLGAGNVDVPFSRGLTGLVPGTTYYFCAIGRNAYGTAFGAVLSFTTLATSPTITTVSATSITPTGATLNGSGNPNGSNTTGWFRYGTASPGSCNDSFGTRAPAAGGSALGGGTSTVAFSQNITGLNSGTIYYYCAIGQNSVGLSFGTVLSFTTTIAPAVVTLAATPVTATTATLNGNVNPNGNATTGWFRYATVDPGTCDNSFGTITNTTALGSGTSGVAMSQALTGLAPATTYYFCAIAQSSIGISFGAVLSFTTPAAPPTIVTVAASSITATTATINATANPNGSTTTGWFRYATSHPGTCNDMFGTRIPAMGGTDVGGGNMVVPFSENLSGLTAGTTYYYCALGSSVIGTSVGSVLSFTTADLPVVTTSAATALSSTGATLNGSANPNNAAATGYFRYATTNPGTCNDSFGTRAPAAGGTSLGSGSSAVVYSQVVTGLVPGTTYYFCAIAQNVVGTGFGTVLSFTTTAVPTVTTTAASVITATGATLNGSATPNLSASTGWFRYSLTDPGTCNDSFGTRAPAAGGTSLGAGSTPVAYAQAITGLTAATTYYYCAIASNAAGTGVGMVMSFTTASAPTVVTDPATGVTTTAATLNGSANPNQLTATGWFRYSTTSPGTCNDSFGTRTPAAGGTALGAGSALVPYSQALTGLVSGTTYYYCAIASNSQGTRFGAVLSFTTPAIPLVTTSAATAISSTGATLNGSANPRGSAGTGWYRYSTTNPGTCNDMFGTRAPVAGGTSLGSGNTAVSYSEVVTGLAPATTYYFCAIADNAQGTGVGSVLSFTTTATPAVTTNAATAITSTGATLNGSANPRLSATTGWYRYSTINPGTCDDTFGTRAPAAGGTSLGSGSTAVAYTQAITGLTSSTTYYFCAIASNAEGLGFGAILSFTTASAPTVTTVAATSITATGATVNGSANPNGLTATGWLRYSPTNPGTCNDSFGTRLPAAGGTALGAGMSAVAYSQAITGLVSGTTYYYCALASNSAGTGVGMVMSFTTAGAPTVTTEVATGISTTDATLNGTANPNTLTATGWFRYSTTNPGTCNDSFGTRTPAAGGTALGAGTSAVPYSQPLTGLVTGTTYYYCAIAQNSSGTRFGTVLSFTTAAVPIVTTNAASSVAASTATLNGSANPNLSAATGWFRYSATNPGVCNDSFGTRAPGAGGTSLGSGSSGVAFSEPITGLTPSTTYYFCAIASNSNGLGVGSVLSFTTPSTPTVTTNVASGVTSTTVTLNGSANPNGSTATGWFRYSTINPGACDDVFGTRAPAASGSLLGSGNSAVAYSQPVNGLSAGTTYYYCAIASNAVGNGFGSVMSFTTSAPPTVVTDAATAITSTTATLNGTVNPNQLASSGWFRYSTTNPGTCDDNFGTRAPTSGGTAIAAGSMPVTYQRAIVGLTPATTYYFCAIASNSAGTSFGAVLSFMTPSAPSVVTDPATGVGATMATLNGSANPNLDTTTGWYRYSTTNPGTCNDIFGTRAPTAGGTALGNGSFAVAYSEVLTGLTPGATYYFCAIAQNGAGTRFGSVLSFTTTAAPTVTTDPATAVSDADAILNGKATPNGDDATGYFRYDTTNPGTCNDAFGTAVGGSTLGNGSMSVPFAHLLTGLAPATTYYYCAIAQNSIGKGYGAVLSFKTLGAPTASTDVAAVLSSTSANINGTATANGADTTAWFRFDTVDPGMCDDAFGTRAPMSGGTMIGSGTMPVPFTQGLMGLMPLTTYYYCAIAENSVGKTYGAVLSFTTSDGPIVTTEAASDLMGTTATLNATATPNFATTTVWFRYDLMDPGMCDDSFGTRAPDMGGTDVGAGGTAVPVPQAITGLLPTTTYYFCAIAQNANGTSFGEVLSFTTGAGAPTVITLPPTNVTSTSAELNGSADPNGDAATGWFRFDTVDPGTCNDTFGTRAPAAGGTMLGAGTDPVTFTEIVTGLIPETTYYYCAIAENAFGKQFGEVQVFKPGTTAPTVTTEDATDVLSTGATLQGTANPNGTDSTGWFRLGDIDPGTNACDDSYGNRVPDSSGVMLGAGATALPFSQAAIDLLPNKTYYYCAAASNLGGASFGAFKSFTTPAAPPTVTTSMAEVTGPGAATLNGSANPNGSKTSVWFRFDTTDPGTCNDTFGTRIPTPDGKDIGTDYMAVDFSEAVAGLPIGTYFACAIASNDAGIAFGEVVSFEITESGEVDPPPPPPSGDCGCRTIANQNGSTGSLVLAALTLLAFRRRRRAA